MNDSNYPYITRLLRDPRWKVGKLTILCREREEGITINLYLDVDRMYAKSGFETISVGLDDLEQYCKKLLEE